MKKRYKYWRKATCPRCGKMQRVWRGSYLQKKADWNGYQTSVSCDDCDTLSVKYYDSDYKFMCWQNGFMVAELQSEGIPF